MATVWYDHYAGCPYYKRSDGKRDVICEGPCDDCDLILRKKNHDAFLIQVKTFCCDKYKNCEIYQMLKQIYEDDDNG